ncbi:MAG TPA: DNA mismatch repair protein MutS [Candidatus Eisenbacteria bacterium]|nr:DNA mismatch repair protein MutS [Candidatus Eisenbacteria bacterium]
MRVLLMHRDRDFDLYQPESWNRYGRRQEFDRGTLLRSLLWNAPALLQDLELDTLFRAMAGGDEFVFAIAQQALFSGFKNDLDTILYRQAVLKDCIANPTVVRGLYDSMTAVGEETRRHWWGLSSEYPGSMLYSAVDMMEMLIGVLRQLRKIAEEQQAAFHSEAFTSMFSMLRKELGEDYLAEIKDHLSELKFRKGALVSAQLGDTNEGTNYMLRKPHGKEPNWLDRLLGKVPPGYTFRLDPRDEAGGKILTNMRNRGIVRVARALSQSAEHVLGFFKMLRTELAFYVGALNLHAHLVSRGMPVIFPTPRRAGERKQEFRSMYDVCFVLTMNRAVVANTINANRKNLVIITGANHGGKSTFLRSVGVAQLMMQCGLFVGAEAFESEICPALFTHYKREEDTRMKSGKFDEELSRMSEIADHVVPNSMLLFNESFAATNEREGSDIAGQIVRALLEKATKVFFVTHLYEFASRYYDEKSNGALFLRAERKEDGTRTFKLVEGQPLETSYGTDLYREVFEIERQPSNVTSSSQ